MLFGRPYDLCWSTADPLISNPMLHRWRHGPGRKFGAWSECLLYYLYWQAEKPHRAQMQRHFEKPVDQ
jgi:hypothetical protein